MVSGKAYGSPFDRSPSELSEIYAYMYISIHACSCIHVDRHYMITMCNYMNLVYSVQKRVQIKPLCIHTYSNLSHNLMRPAPAFIVVCLLRMLLSPFSNVLKKESDATSMHHTQSKRDILCSRIVDAAPIVHFCEYAELRLRGASGNF